MRTTQRTLAVVVLGTVGAVGYLGAQRNIQNGRVETRVTTTITREIAAVGTNPSPVWVAWSVPMVAGDRNLCSTWSDGNSVMRGETLERKDGSRPSAVTPPAGPVRLEGGTTLVVLARILDGRLERLRSIADDCPVDASGTTVHWLTGVTPADSLQYLEGLTRAEALNVSATRRNAESAVSAIALHQDASAFAVLDRLSSVATGDGGLRRQAASGLAAHRGAEGFNRVMALVKNERGADIRRGFVGALAQSPQPNATDALLDIARNDADAGVRADAVTRYIRRAGQAGLATALVILDTDASEEVKRRVVSGIGSLPEPVAAPALVRLARTHSNVAVRKGAVSALGRFSDPQARALLEELLR